MLFIGRDVISTPPPRRSSSISGASLMYSLALRPLSSTALEMILALPPMEVSSEDSTAVALTASSITSGVNSRQSESHRKWRTSDLRK